MKNIFVCILIIVFSTSGLWSQSISVFNLDHSQFPKIKAKMFVLDAKGEIATGIDKNNIIITEDGLNRDLTSLDCPIPKPPDAISSILTIDVSGSMTGNGMTMAKAAANAWVQAIPLGKSECAITSFDTQNYLNCDFTTDRQKLLNSILLLKPQGGTDFNAALIDRMFGSLILAERGKHKKTVVFLTDGYASGSETEIVNKANALNASIYCVVLGNKAPAILKNIAARTGGECFDEITDAEQAENCYKNILNKVQGGEPCSIEWLSDGCPDNRIVNISVPKFEISTKDRYSVNFDLLPKILILPNNSLRFGPVAPGNFVTKKIKLISSAQSIRIDSITGNNKRFKVLDFPAEGIILNPESQAEFSIEFFPFDSAYQFTRFNIHSNACIGNYFYASGGFNGGKNNTLSIIEPNGNELYAASADTAIKWDGIPASDTVLIEISTDGGFRWHKVSDYSIGLTQNHTLPNTNSDKCLIRVKQLESTGSKLINIQPFTYFVSSVSISPNSKFIATCGEEKSFKIFNLSTGELIYSENTFLAYRHARFSPDGSKIAIAMSDYSVRILSAANWSLISTIKEANSWVEEMAFSGDGSKLALVSNDNGKKNAKIIDLSTFAAITTADHAQSINDIVCSSDGSKFITTSDDGTIKIWDATSGSELKTISGAMQSYEAISPSPEGSRLAVSANNGSKFAIIDIQSGQVIHQHSMSNAAITDVSWSYDGQSIAIATNKSGIILFSGENYDSLRVFQDNPFKINDVEWSRDSKFLVAGTNDNFVRVWNFELIIQEAVSENYWSIVSPAYSLGQISFDKYAIGSIKDSIFQDLIANNSKVPLNINKYEIIGSDANAFSLVSNIPPLTVPAYQSQYGELQFRPYKAGLHNANLKIYTQIDTTTISISGEGYDPKFTEIIKYIDFGQIYVDTRKDTTVNVLRNKSTANLIIESVKIIGPDIEQFYLTEPSESKTIAPNEYFSLPLAYFPISRGKANTAIAISFLGESNPVQIQLIGEGLSDCGAESFSINDFEYRRHLLYLGDATPSGEALTLNPSKNYTLGGAVTKKRLPVDSGFVSTYSFAITEPYQSANNENSYPGADGISFVIHNSDNMKVGRGGGGVGYEGIKNGLAIELDLFANDSSQPENNNDPNGNHLAVFRITPGDTILRSKHTPQSVLMINPNIPIIRSDGTIYYQKVEYIPSLKELLIFIDTVADFKSPAIVLSDFDLSNYIDMEYSKGVYLAILATSGNSRQSHTILSWNTCTYSTANSVPAEIDDEIRLLDESISVYPNPSSGKTMLTIETETAKSCTVSVFNSLGEVILPPNTHLLNNSRTTIPLPDSLPSGNLFIKIEIDGFTIMKHLVKM